MVAKNESEAAHMNQTSLELKGDREIVIDADLQRAAADRLRRLDQA